jgi:hypothetical protein
MRRILTLSTVVVSLLIFSACSSSKNWRLQTRQRSIQRHQGDFNQIITRPERPSCSVQQAVQRHENEIANYKASEDPERWVKIIAELQYLQDIYSAPTLQANDGFGSKL